MNKVKVKLGMVDLSNADVLVRYFFKITVMPLVFLFFSILSMTFYFRKVEDVHIGEILSFFLCIGVTASFYLLFLKRVREKFLDPLSKRLERVEELEKKCDVAHQVAHDIRSPLAILHMMVGPDIYTASEESRIMFKQQVERIESIASDLNRKKVVAETPSEETISSIIKQIVSEKRLLISCESNIKIDYAFYDLKEEKENINPEKALELKRLLSNLINNAIESFYENAQFKNVFIKVSSILEKEIPTMQIIIKDNGRGIPLHIMRHLGKKGFSFGKNNLTEAGAGLGLFHAKTTVDSWKGHLLLESQEGVGTSVTIEWPIQK